MATKKDEFLRREFAAERKAAERRARDGLRGAIAEIRLRDYNKAAILAAEAIQALGEASVCEDFPSFLENRLENIEKGKWRSRVERMRK